MVQVTKYDTDCWCRERGRLWLMVSFSFLFLFHKIKENKKTERCEQMTEWACIWQAFSILNFCISETKISQLDLDLTSYATNESPNHCCLMQTPDQPTNPNHRSKNLQSTMKKRICERQAATQSSYFNTNSHPPSTLCLPAVPLRLTTTENLPKPYRATLMGKHSILTRPTCGALQQARDWEAVQVGLRMFKARSIVRKRKDCREQWG